MQPFWKEDLAPDSSVLEKLDVNLNMASLAYYSVNRNAYALPEIFDDADGLPKPAYLELHDAIVSKLVLVSDARAKFEERDNTDEELEWVEVARRGIYRVAQRVGIPGMRHMEQSQFLSPGHEDLQRAAYRDMCQRRDGEGPLDLPPATYAAHVAFGEIFV